MINTKRYLIYNVNNGNEFLNYQATSKKAVKKWLNLKVSDYILDKIIKNNEVVKDQFNNKYQIVLSK